MKKKAGLLLLLAALSLLTLGTAAFAKTTTGWVTDGKKTYYYDNGVMLKKQWVEVDGHDYWLNKNGVRYSKKGWLTLGKNKYYICKKGYRITGPKKIDGKKYYFDEETGRLVTGKRAYQINGKWYTISTKGVVRKANRSNIKVDCSIKTQEFIEYHTKSNPNMSNAEKFRTCFNYIIGYTKYVANSPLSDEQAATKTWPYEFAVEALDSGGGKGGVQGGCYHMASLIASCAKELGYEPYVIAITAQHGFVEIDGKYYDNMGGGLFGADRPAIYPYTVRSKVKFK